LTRREAAAAELLGLPLVADAVPPQNQQQQQQQELSSLDEEFQARLRALQEEYDGRGGRGLQQQQKQQTWEEERAEFETVIAALQGELARVRERAG
jgi:restriction endonuclease S subunit